MTELSHYPHPTCMSTTAAKWLPAAERRSQQIRLRRRRRGELVASIEFLDSMPNCRSSRRRKCCLLRSLLLLVVDILLMMELLMLLPCATALPMPAHGTPRPLVSHNIGSSSFLRNIHAYAIPVTVSMEASLPRTGHKKN